MQNVSELSESALSDKEAAHAKRKAFFCTITAMEEDDCAALNDAKGLRQVHNMASTGSVFLASGLWRSCTVSIETCVLSVFLMAGSLFAT